MKYIRYGMTIISFTPEISHSTMNASMPGFREPDSAGFWKLDKATGKIVTYGRSDSLNIDRNDIELDEMLLNNM